MLSLLPSTMPHFKHVTTVGTNSREPRREDMDSTRRHDCAQVNARQRESTRVNENQRRSTTINATMEYREAHI